MFIGSKMILIIPLTIKIIVDLLKSNFYVKLHVIKNNYIKYMLLNNFPNYAKSF